MVQKKGFTNMAQAFALAETMYTAAGRKCAQSALLVITDGKPSFQFQTNELVQQLDDKGVQRFFVVVSDRQPTMMTMTWLPPMHQCTRAPAVASLTPCYGPADEAKEAQSLPPRKDQVTWMANEGR